MWVAIRGAVLELQLGVPQHAIRDTMAGVLVREQRSSTLSLGLEAKLHLNNNCAAPSESSNTHTAMIGQLHAMLQCFNATCGMLTTCEGPRFHRARRHSR